MALSNIIECGGFYFIHNFDSGNLGHVERVPTELIAPQINVKTGTMEQPDYEFNLWTRPDCAGTEFENGNRTWFYFGIQASEPLILVRLNMINLNKQGKMYNQGMAPVTRTLPGKPQWERIRDRPIHSMDDNTFTLSFRFRTAENVKATTFFAFTYPFSFAELQISLNSIDMRMLPLPPPQSPDDIYYARECLINSLEGRRVDLLTITSHHGMTTEREDRLKHLFPENKPRPHKFQNKKVVFISARVHPGETPSSFVFNGFLNLLLNRNDPIAIQLRKLYVFKMIPFLNPDGVARGHYRTDTRGVNLNRVYLNPSLTEHPTVYASRALIRYYHFGCETEDNCEDIKLFPTRSTPSMCESESVDQKKKRPQNPSFIKSADVFRKEKTKALSTNKSVTSMNKSSITEPKKDKGVGMSGAASNLADQVFDMRLQEELPLASSTSSPPSPAPTTETESLQDQVVRACLGVRVHVSPSAQLAGTNPLRPLREALNNSISLLMSSSSSVAGSGSERVGSQMSHVRMGWCKECRPAAAPTVRDEPVTYRTIEEYGEHQKQQISDLQRKKEQESTLENGDNSYFCTNCFRRFIGTESDEEYTCSAVSCSPRGATGDTLGGRDVSPRDVTARDVIPRDNSAANTLSPTVAENTILQPPAPKEPKSARAMRKKPPPPPPAPHKEVDSGLFLYIDLHGHASKKGIFMYGNYFPDVESSVECMLLPRIMSLNSLHFHFSSCNFTERNMYLKDRRDGMSREGSGRVAVLKATGLVRSYTLECNYNTGRLVNVLPPAPRDPVAPAVPPTPAHPPKYTPHIFEDVGRSLGASILDVTGAHPASRLPASEHRSLPALRDWLRAHAAIKPPLTAASRLRAKVSSPSRLPLFTRPRGKDERKENAYQAARAEPELKASPFLQRSTHDLVPLKYAKKNESQKPAARARYLAENEPKPRTLAIKRKNILAIRKPNSSKTQIGVGKAKPRRAADDSENSRSATKLGKRSYSRGGRVPRAMASSSSEEFGGWEEVSGGTALAADAAVKRRPFPQPSTATLKKIRLKTSS